MDKEVLQNNTDFKFLIKVRQIGYIRIDLLHRLIEILSAPCRCGWRTMLSSMILQKSGRSSRRNKWRCDDHCVSVGNCDSRWPLWDSTDAFCSLIVACSPNQKHPLDWHQCSTGCPLYSPRITDESTPSYLTHLIHLLPFHPRLFKSLHYAVEIV